MPRGVRRGDFPRSVEVLLGEPGGDARHLDVADIGVVGGGDLLLGVVAARHHHLHVRLPGADPHITKHDVVQHYGVLAGHGEVVGPAHRGRG